MSTTDLHVFVTYDRFEGNRITGAILNLGAPRLPFEYGDGERYGIRAVQLDEIDSDGGLDLSDVPCVVVAAQATPPVSLVRTPPDRFKAVAAREIMKRRDTAGAA